MNIHLDLSADWDVRELVDRILPGPFTILIDSIDSNLSPLVNKSSNYIGIRVPNHSFPIKIVETLGNPIITTSVNKKNKTPLNDIREMGKKFSNIDIDTSVAIAFR